MMFGVVLVGTYTSVFIASPILIYLGVGTGRTEHVDTPTAPEPERAPVPAKARP
jgi:preprotein translocase subunit SecF